MSLGRSGPGVRGGCLETPRTRFGGVFLAPRADRVAIRSFPTCVGRVRHRSEAVNIDHGQVVYPSPQRVPGSGACDSDSRRSSLPWHPPGDLAALTERVRRRVIRWFRLARLLDAAAAAAQASASLPRGVCTQPQAQAGRHGAGNRECRQAARRRDRRAYRRRSRHRPSTTRTRNQPTARPVPNRTGCVPFFRPA